MKIAIVHDWLITYGGAERELAQILKIFPEADLFALYDFLPEKDRDILNGKPVHTSFLQRMPWARTKYRSYLPFMPYAIEQFDLSGYDLVISSSFAVAKGVITGPDQLHICVCYSPPRYAWDLTHQYLRESGLSHGLQGLFAKWILHYLRIWDHRTSAGVDQFVAISNYISRRIEKTYRRPSTVIYPPVEIGDFELCTRKEDYYFTASRLVPYKRVDLIVEAFAAMPEKRLVVIGEGPDFEKVRSKAKENVTLLSYQPHAVLSQHMQRAKAFVFAAEEDFGIVPLEAQACGTPVIAFARGGASETVRDGVTGLFFSDQSVPAIVDAVRRFEALGGQFDPSEISRFAARFSAERFRTEFKAFVEKSLSEFTDRKKPEKSVLV